MSLNGKLVLLANQVHQLSAALYLEGVKCRMIQKKALTSGDKSFSILLKQQQGKVAVIGAERDHFIGEFESLKSMLQEE